MDPHMRLLYHALNFMGRTLSLVVKIVVLVVTR